MSGPDTLVERLREGFQGDHDRGCEGRQYTCSCGYDERFHLAAEEAAAELSALRERCETAERALAFTESELEAILAARDEAVAALRRIAEGNLGDAAWQANYEKIREVARAALPAPPPGEAQP